LEKDQKEEESLEGLVAHFLMNESLGYFVKDELSGGQAPVRGNFRWAQASFV
jgi:hypothetical protein